MTCGKSNTSGANMWQRESEIHNLEQVLLEKDSMNLNWDNVPKQLTSTSNKTVYIKYQ
jgi:hypothetical protein